MLMELRFFENGEVNVGIYYRTTYFLEPVCYG